VGVHSQPGQGLNIQNLLARKVCQTSSQAPTEDSQPRTRTKVPRGTETVLVAGKMKEALLGVEFSDLLTRKRVTRFLSASGREIEAIEIGPIFSMGPIHLLSDRHHDARNSTGPPMARQLAKLHPGIRVPVHGLATRKLDETQHEKPPPGTVSFLQKKPFPKGRFLDSQGAPKRFDLAELACTWVTSYFHPETFVQCNSS